ncbi:hypothetical protein PG991_007196 [Apiospora marii]|uniref:Uncharacterized protein n=1 Tax=Apiospora marii TaxID=335849 RepID=A0ABR1RTY7_9PEZI
MAPWCGAGAPGCGNGTNATGAAAPPIPWFKTRGVSPYSVFYEGILTVPSNETSTSPDGEGDRQVESGSGGKKKRFEGLLVIPGI